MATKIVTKNSSTASAVPTASDLVQGELAVNVADKRLFTEDNGGSIVELGTNPSTIDINAGSIDGTAIGASSASTGAFTTLTATGIDVTGTATMDGLTVDSGTVDTVATFQSSGDANAYVVVKDSGSSGGAFIGAVGTHTILGTGGSTERMRIDSSGNVGIGTTAASANLTINKGAGSSSPTTFTTANSYLQLGVDDYNSSGAVYAIGFGYSGGATHSPAYIGLQQTEVGSYTKGDLVFRTRSTSTDVEPPERMRIDSSGNLLVGRTASTSAKLHLENATDVHMDMNSVGDNRGKIGSKTNDFYIGHSSSAANIIFKRNIGSDDHPADSGNETMRIDSSGNVGIGISNPSDYYAENLVVDAPAEGGITIKSASTDHAYLMFADGTNGAEAYRGYLGHNHANDATVLVSFGTVNLSSVNETIFTTNTSERMRIDSSGNLLVGTTDTTLFNNTSGGGFSVSSNGLTQIAKQGGDSADPVLMLNQTGLDGEILRFYKDGTSVGTIGAKDGDLYIGTNDTALRFYDASNFIYPVSTVTGTSRDNAIDLGYSSGRFKDIYRSGSTYQSSDRTLKQDIRDLTDSERNVAVACKGLLKAFRFIDAVEKDGDDANIHFGVIAQELAEAFEAEGLDANDYQVYKSSTTTDEDGNEQTRLSVCYENLLAFIISAI